MLCDPHTLGPFFVGCHSSGYRRVCTLGQNASPHRISHHSYNVAEISQFMQPHNSTLLQLNISFTHY